MDSQQTKEKAPNCLMGAIMTLSLLSAATAIGLVVLTSLWGNSGLIGETSIVIQSCSCNYFTQKMDNLDIVNRTVFISSLLAALISLQITLISSGWLCKKFDTSRLPSVPRAKLFFFCSCLVMSSIPPLGYYFAFYIQMKNCTYSVDFSQIVITLVVAAALISMNFTLLLIVLCKNSSEPSEKKYRVVETNQTQPVETIKYCKYDEKINQKFNNLMQKSANRPALDDNNVINDDTNEAIVIPCHENINFSPRRPLPEYRPQLYQPKNHHTPTGKERELHKVDQVLQQHENRKSPVYKQQRIITNLHPQFANANPSQYKQAERKDQIPQLDVQAEFFREQQKYLQNVDQNMFPRGLQQRDNHRNHDNIDYNRPGQHYQGNYAKVYHADERSPYYSPNRVKNQGLRQSGRKYISNDNQRNYPIQPNQYYNYQNNYRHPAQRNSPNQRNYNSRDYDQQQQSFKFYEESYPRNNYYR